MIHFCLMSILGVLSKIEKCNKIKKKKRKKKKPRHKGREVGPGEHVRVPRWTRTQKTISFSALPFLVM